MFTQIVTSNSSDLIVHLPDELVGKQIEINITERKQTSEKIKEIPKSTLTKEHFEEMFGILEGSEINIESIRKKAWRKYHL